MGKYRLKIGFIFLFRELHFALLTQQYSVLTFSSSREVYSLAPFSLCSAGMLPKIASLLSIAICTKAQSSIWRKHNAIKWQVQCKCQCAQIKYVPAVWIAPGISYSELEQLGKQKGMPWRQFTFMAFFTSPSMVLYGFLWGILSKYEMSSSDSCQMHHYNKAMSRLKNYWISQPQCQFRPSDKPV